MKVLVTGGCGFLGSHLCEFYKNQGEEVIAYDNLTKFEFSRTGYQIEGARSHNKNYLTNIGVKIYEGDVRSSETLMKIGTDCDYIIHTAAQPAMTIAIEDPEMDFDTNVKGTFNILDMARKFDIPLVSCSTIHVYGNALNAGLIEKPTRFSRNPPVIDEMYPTMTGLISPLHASKRTGELYVQAYVDTYGLKAASFRLSGMYGPRQFGGEDHGWVANFAIRTILGLPIKIFGTDKQVRDILFASDAVRAFDAFYHNQKPGLYNIGGGEKTSISIQECMKLIKSISGMEQSISLDKARHGDLWYFVSDISKAKKVLGWEPEILPEEGIEKLINWIDSIKHIFTDKK